MGWYRSFCCGVFLASGLPAAVTAQDPPVAGTRQFTRLQEAVAGQRVMAVHGDGRQEELRGVALYRTGELRHPNDSPGLPISSLRTIKVRKSAAGRGARIGAFVGGLSFLAMGVSMAQDDFFEAGGGEVAMLTLVGLGSGALTGAVLGAPFHYWKTVYHASGTVQSVVGFSKGAMRVGARVSF